MEAAMAHRAVREVVESCKIAAKLQKENTATSFPTPAETAAPAASSHDRILAAAKRLFASQGYEATSTMAIARLAGTSESQMMKHFGSKEGLLEAILDAGWKSMAGPLSEIASMPAGQKKLLAMFKVVLNTLTEDADLKELFLLEGRRVRREGRMVVLSPGYLKFVGMVDEVLHQMHRGGTLKPDVNPEAVRSAIMGMAEGMMRDQVLSRRREFPANYTNGDFERIYELCLHAVTQKPTVAPAKAKAGNHRSATPRKR
jgi:AcrR family transcriptional regulator